MLLCNDSDEIPGWTLGAGEKDVLNWIPSLPLLAQSLTWEATPQPPFPEVK